MRTKVLLVTGSGRGIGAATAILAASRGYAVCVNYLQNHEQARMVASEIQGAGGRVALVQADITDESDVGRLFDATERELGPITALVNNAGFLGRMGRLIDLDLNTLRRIIDVNLVGTFLCSREAVRRMSTRLGGVGGAIVNVSSVAARLGGANEWIVYAAAKGAIDSFTIGLARETAAEGIRVNAVSPGLIATESHAEVGHGDRLTTLGPTVPMQRVGSAYEVAEAILWLASGESAYTIGANLSVAGGR